MPRDEVAIASPAPLLRRNEIFKVLDDDRVSLAFDATRQIECLCEAYNDLAEAWLYKIEGPEPPESVALRALVQRIKRLNSAVMTAVSDDHESNEVVAKITRQ